MIKNLLGKKDEGAQSDVEVQKLREKLNRIVNSDEAESVRQEPAAKETGPAPAGAQQGIQQGSQPAQAAYQYVDPERAEDSERVTNLIMQQIKELIEIDNNLNTKIKEVENRMTENASVIANTKNIVEQFNSRLEFIEKNMEKFMGLYEVVTNRFNPFVSQDDDDLATPAPAQEALFGPEEKKKIDIETHDIIESSGVKNKLDSEQEAVVEAELKKAVGFVGPNEAEKMKKELAEHLADTLGRHIRDAMSHHAQLTADELKNSIKEMLLETVASVKEVMSAHRGQAGNPGAGASPQGQHAEHAEQAPAQAAVPGTTAPAQAPSQSSAQASAGTASAQSGQRVGQAAEPAPGAGREPPESASGHSLHEEVHPDYHFYLSDGTPIKSVKGLMVALAKMDNDTFKSHVTPERNDFADWIEAVVGDHELAQKISQLRTKDEILAVLRSL